MSGSEYRSEREAARARVAALEAELRDLEAVAPKSLPPPEAASTEEKKNYAAA